MRLTNKKIIFSVLAITVLVTLGIFFFTRSPSRSLAATQQTVTSQKGVACSLEKNITACSMGYDYATGSPSASPITYCSQVAGFKSGSSDYTSCVNGMARAVAALGLTDKQAQGCGKYLKTYVPGESYSSVPGMSACLKNPPKSAGSGSTTANKPKPKPTPAKPSTSTKPATTTPASQTPTPDPTFGQQCSTGNCDLINKYINPGINLLSLAFGVIAAISIVMGGIQYSTSIGDPQKISSAKSRITNTMIAIVAYLFLYSFLEFLVPGGIFNK